tara:strand:+ start:350 stop:997 length:648 start_codon:yes stop_codon:yes gene_type:complete
MDMSAKGIRGNVELRRGLGSKTTDREKIMEDGPAGDWLALRSDHLLKWIDDAVYNASEATGMREVVNRVTRPIFNFAQRFSPHPLHFGIMCCAIEMGQASAPDHDIDRLGLVYRSSPRQCDVLIVNGPVCEKLRPKLKTLYEQMPEPKWVIAMGECAISGGPYWDSYSVVAGADTFMPVDVYIPGCPVRPEALMHGFLTLQKKIREKEPGMFLRR